MDDKDTSRYALIFALPFLRAVGMKNAVKAMTLAVGCWNLSLLPKELRAAEEAKILQCFDFATSWFPESADGIHEMKTWMQRLIHRKNTKYKHRRRLIFTHLISIRGETVTLTTGTMEAPEDPNDCPAVSP